MKARDFVRWFLAGNAIGLLILGAALLVGCPAPLPPTPTPGPPPSSPASCVRACDHLRGDLRCPVSDDCGNVCDRVDDQRFTDCLAAAVDCAAADRCDAR